MALPLASQTVVLNDRTRATIHPVWDGSQLPLELVASLCVEYNAEIDRGRSFPETQKMMLENFEKSWFSGVAGVMVRGDESSQRLLEDFDLLDNNECLGSFWIQPCFPGRSSHICTANFLVRSKFRNCGVGKAMGQCFLRWALQLGYDYALFNLVYDCNVAACKILDRLGFTVVNVLKGAGILKGFNHPVDAFMFGRSLLGTDGPTPGASGMTPGRTPEAGHTPKMLDSRHTPSNSRHTELETARVMPLQGSDVRVSNAKQPAPLPLHSAGDVALSATPGDNKGKGMAIGSASVSQGSLPSEYEHIRVYLTTGTYPPETNRTERTRIRSRSRSYEVLNGTLLFKRTHVPVVATEADQLRIATELHRKNHNGINKLQKMILSMYHWHGVRDTIVQAIKNCPECRAANNRPDTNPLMASTSRSLSQELSQIDEELRLADSVEMPSAVPQPPPLQQLPSHSLDLNINSSMFGSPYFTDTMADTIDPNNIVYLPPENEDDEYVPDGTDLDLGLGGQVNADIGEEEEDLFRDEDDDEDWSAEYQEEDEEDSDEDEDDDEEDNDGAYQT